MTTLLLATLALTVVGSLVTFLAVRQAPEGYEDETGFHAVGSTGQSHPALEGNHLADGVA